MIASDVCIRCHFPFTPSETRYLVDGNKSAHEGCVRADVPVRWQINCAGAFTDAASRLMEDGWEPFAVGRFAGDDVMYFRRQKRTFAVKEPQS